MESGTNLSLKLNGLHNALTGFSTSLLIEFDKFDSITIDTIKNGQIQKFEYCIELTWKVIQLFLREKLGEDLSSPKPVIKVFYLNKFIDQPTYERLFEMINTRNELSHIYREEVLDEIYPVLPEYCKTMKLIYQILSNHLENN